MNQPGEYGEDESVEETLEFFSMFEDQPWMMDLDGAEEEDDYKAKKWRDVKPTNNYVLVTIAEAQEESWKQAVMEIKERVAMMKDRAGTDHPAPEDCVSLIYSKDGAIYWLFKLELHWEYSFFCKFLATIAFQNSMNLSSTTPHSKHASRVSKYCLLSKEEFNGAWDSIGKLDLPRKGKPTNVLGVGKKYFWKKLQDTFNDLYCELFVQKTAGMAWKMASMPCDDGSDESTVSSKSAEDDYLQKFVIDDFKVCFVSLNKETAGLKILQHTRANQRGPVMHQVVKTASSGVIIGYYFEMEGNSEDRNNQPVEGTAYSNDGDRAYNKKVVCRGLCIRVDRTATELEKKNNPNDNIGSYRGTCALCGEQNAQYYCFGCHLYFHRHNSIDKDVRKIMRLKILGPDQKFFTELDCYLFSYPILLGGAESLGSYQPLGRAAQKQSASAPAPATGRSVPKIQTGDPRCCCYKTIQTGNRHCCYKNTRTGDGRSIQEMKDEIDHQYHISNNSTDVTCGTARTSILTINGNTKSSTPRCDSNGTLQAQTSKVRTPLPSSPLPNFVVTATGGDATTAIATCNGFIRALDQVLGFDPAVYGFGTNAPCSFYSNESTHSDIESCIKLSLISKVATSNDC
eukprot:jgi/Psemu1/69575/estExt_Genemark1.C_9220011